MYFIFLYLTFCLIQVNADQKTFPTGFSKKDFHVSTLKDPHFEQDHEDTHTEETTKETAKAEEECPDFNPEELKKLKQDFNFDGGQVKYVSADVLPVDKEKIKNAKCQKKILAAEASDKTLKTSFDSPAKFENTTVKTKNDTKTSDQDEAKRRGNEYQFDTIEYYDDEVVKIDNELCPGLVDIIDLELAEIRKYDIECEKICMWTSLYDIGTWVMN